MPKIPQNSGFDLSKLLSAAREQGDGTGIPPVEDWSPDYCGEMNLVIRRDGAWWHENSPIKREAMIRLFSTILRKDEDGQHYLVTPVEKIGIKVELAAFLAVRLDRDGGTDANDPNQTLLLTTNMGEIVALGPQRYLRMMEDPNGGTPVPVINVRGRLEALLTRPVFYELAQYVVEKDGYMGVYSQGLFFPLDIVEH